MQLCATQRLIRRELIESILIFLLGCLMSFVFNSDLITRPWFDIKLIASYSGFMWLFFWKGNQYLVDFWNRRISWLEQPVKRFVIGVLTVVIYTPLILFIINKSYGLLASVSFGWSSTDVLVSIAITFFITFFLFARAFLMNWKKATLDAERLKKEQMATKYETLKNQVNPHFLFNSLNALTNLVYENQDLAARFIRELSRVYRYVLDTRSQEVVSVKTELGFLESYIFLQKIRFEEKLKVNIQVEGFEQRMLPPMCVQMLLENAIKHNVIAEEEPLTVEIFVEEGAMLVVKNNLQKKNIPIEESSGMGLSNVKSRYEFLSRTPVEIIDGPDEFIVKLPLLDFEK